MKPHPFISIPSHLFSSFPVLGSVTAPARASSHSFQREETFEPQNTSSFTETEFNHVHYTNDFRALIRILSNNSRNYGALSALDSMLTKAQYLDSATSLLVIDDLSLLKKQGRAQNVLSNLRKKGKVSDYLLYSFVFHCLVKDGRIEDVESVWDDVCGSELLSMNRRIDASEFVVRVCKSGEVLEIERICKRVLRGCWDLKQQSYIALIGALCRNNNGLLAKELLREMESNMGLKPDNFTYLTLFQCFCRNGDMADADSILRRLLRREYPLDISVYGSFIYGLCKSGKLREADKLFRKLIRSESSAAFGVESLREGKRAVFQLNCQGVVPEIMAYECYCRSLCSVGRLDEAEMLLKEMMRKKAVPEVCVHRSFVKALFRAGRVEDGIRFFNVEKKKGLVPWEEIAGSVILGLCEIGRVDDAWMIFSETMEHAGLVPATDICNRLLGSYWKAGRLAEASSLFERMQDGEFGGIGVSSCMVMIKGLCDQENASKALSIFEEMLKNHIPTNEALYEIIIRGLCLSGRLEEAHKYLNKMIENGLLISYIRWKSLSDSFLAGSKR